jgi:glycosyltransferase involved in cell wall biosynthesis
MTALVPFDLPVTLIGHPFAPIGRGEDLRAAYRGFKAVGIEPHVVNVYNGGSEDRGFVDEFSPAIRRTSAGGVDVFCINGDEIESVIAHLGARLVPAHRTILFPQWELPGYPAEWARSTDRFDHVWAASTFVRDSVASSATIPVTAVQAPTGVTLRRFLGRRYFGIPESAYTFLFAFDLRSYHQRKNPLAVVDAYTDLVAARPGADVALVVKMAGGDVRPEAADALLERLRERTERRGMGRVVVVEQGLTDTETKNLVLCCDSFVSLHRSEGFGRFLAEAMLLGKPVIATAWSGNMEFMNEDVACLVGCRFVPVREGEYPFWRGQSWADPDVDQATAFMVRLVDDPAWGRQVGDRASRHIRSRFSYRAIGLRYTDHLREICA